MAAVESASGPEPQQLVVDIPPGLPFLEEPASVWRTREILAYLLFGLFAVSVLVSLLYIGDESWEQAKEFLQIAVPAEIGLLGAAVGFYFGSESVGDRS
jgi:hypothetical protein